MNMLRAKGGVILGTTPPPNCMDTWTCRLLSEGRQRGDSYWITCFGSKQPTWASAGVGDRNYICILVKDMYKPA